MPKRVPTHRPAWMPPVADKHKDYNRHRRDPVLAKLYGSSRWQKFRALIRTERILCQRCSTAERPVEGTEVHHQVDPRVDMELAFEPDNVELLCLACHNQVTAERRRARTRR